jgi:hypothetical protein
MLWGQQPLKSSETLPLAPVLVQPLLQSAAAMSAKALSSVRWAAL